MLILEHSQWLKFWSSQSECLKTCVVQFYAENIFLGSGPEIRGSNPVIGNFTNIYLLFRRDENKEKEAWNDICLIEINIPNLDD